jgi:hypothetical protein
VTLNPTRRPLSEPERRLLHSRIRELQGRGRRARTVAAPITAGVVVVLWVATLLASDAPPLVITAFWLVCGGGLAFWMRRDAGRDARSFEGMAAGLQSALKMNTADVYDVKARAFAEFEEVEDEGACYAFELSGNRLVFIVGQEFYESARFPSLDFSLVYVVDEAGRAVDMVVDKRGPKAKPARTIPASAKKGMEMPEHLEVRPGTIDGL